ncbi:MAG TPA: FhaA domain-containing protein [Candidatus Limnocylindrales bacterium]
MAGPFAAMERFFERLFERPAARLLAPRLEPVHLQRHLERAMESAGTRHRTRIHVPSRYRVLLHTADLVALSGREALPAELAESLRDYARRRGYLLASRPTVRIEGSPRVSAGQLLVLADPDVGAAPGAAARLASATAAPAAGEPAALASSLPTADVGSAADVAEGGAEEAAGAEAAAAVSDSQPSGTSVYRASKPSVPRAAIAVRGPGRPLQRVPVDGGTLRVGRARDNDIVVDDSRVSRHHGQISVRHGTLVYTDLDSTNGSYLYGNRVHEIALGPNDVIHLGASSLTIESAAG